MIERFTRLSGIKNKKEILENDEKLLYDDIRIKRRENQHHIEILYIFGKQKAGDVMLEEYIQKNLEDTEEKLEKEERKLEECREMEKTIRDEIQQIQEHSDIDFEIFSPRDSDHSLKGKMNQLYENLQLLTESIEKLEKNIEQYKTKKQEFSIMYQEWEEMKKKAAK